MRNPIGLAHLFADIMNSRDVSRFGELVSENYVNHNPNVEPGLKGVVAFMGHGFKTLSDTSVSVDDAFAVGDRGRALHLSGSPHGAVRRRARLGR